jgi:hypothetical protein
VSLLELTAAIAGQLEQQLTIDEIPELQVTALINYNPTPPAIDVYPADPFQEQIAYGAAMREAVFQIRARVSNADQDQGQTLLLQMLDPGSPLSVTAALTADPGFANNCQDSAVEGPSGVLDFPDPGGQGNFLTGALWRLRVIL